MLEITNSLFLMKHLQIEAIIHAPANMVWKELISFADHLK